jgi:hypothetical protein
MVDREGRTADRLNQNPGRHNAILSTDLNAQSPPPSTPRGQ